MQNFPFFLRNPEDALIIIHCYYNKNICIFLISFLNDIFLSCFFLPYFT